MKDMDRAADRIRRALADGERIAVFGDYDVDGITSTVLLVGEPAPASRLRPPLPDA